MTETILVEVPSVASERRKGSGEPTQGERVQRLLAERPDLENRPSVVAKLLTIPIGSAKRLLKEHRDARKPELIDLLGPLHLQNVRLIGRTLPGMSPSGSPSLVALGPWSDNGDGKLTATVHLHDGHVTVAVSKTSDTIEVLFATPRGMTPSEVMMALSLLRLPLDRESEAKFSTEVLRDGSSFTFGEARTWRTVEGIEGFLLKMYDHTDSRGTQGRVEVRTPPVKVAWREVESFLEGKQPLGRDSKLEALTLQVHENSEALLMLRREVKEGARGDGFGVRFAGQFGKRFDTTPGCPAMSGIDAPCAAAEPRRGT